MKFKNLKTSKLFYNKWPYKIECVQRGANRMFRNPDGTVHAWSQEYGRYNGQPWTKGEKDRLTDFHEKVSQYYDKDLQIRVEGSRFNIFLKDKELLDDICNVLESWVIRVSGPDSEEELEFLMANGHKKRVCNEYPKEIYHYRVYLNEKLTPEFKSKFLAWALKYDKKINISASSLKWLKGESYYMQKPFFYVEDGATLSMVLLFLGDGVKIVEEFILRSSINISLDQEKSCQPLVKA